MSLSKEKLSGLVEKYLPIMRFTIGEDSHHILFHLKNDKEISISLKELNGKFEGLGQLRNRNQRGFGEASCILKEDTELNLVTAIIENLLDYNLQGQNR